MPPGRAGKSGANPVTATGEPVPQMPASPPGPEGEPQPGNTPVSFPPQGSVAVPPPTAFYPGNGVTPPPQVTYQSVPVPNRIQRKVFTRNEGKQGPSLPYIPSGSFAKAMLIEGADANASVTGNESTVPMQLRITGRWKCRTARRMTQRDVCGSGSRGCVQ
ncbi:hypothetical protein BANRA_04718 [Escherichia coli]|nr:hypothetical protein BANRA_04718 [Escherichia coli]